MSSFSFSVLSEFLLPSAAVLVFFAGAAGTGIVSADFRRSAYYLGVFRFAA